jgi:hypothetical protein
MILLRASMLLFALLVTACTPVPSEQHREPVDPGGEYLLTTEQLGAVEKEAEAGSPDAMRRLLQHYSLGKHDEEKRFVWTARIAAAEPNNWVAQLNHASLQISSGGAENCAMAKSTLAKLSMSTDERARLRSKTMREAMRESGKCPSDM